MSAGSSKVLFRFLPLGAVFAAGVFVSSCVSSLDGVSDTASIAQSADNDQIAALATEVEVEGSDQATITEFVPTRAPREGAVVQQLAEVAKTEDPGVQVAAPAEPPQAAQAQVSTAQAPTNATASPVTAETQVAPTTPETTVASLPETSTDTAGNQAKKPTLFQRLFQANSASKKNSVTDRSSAARTKRRSAKPKIVASVRNSGNSDLPGVKRSSKLFGINSDEENEDEIQVASVGGFGRLSPNGLRLQHEKVQVSCLKPELLRVLKIVERRYKQKPIITSGYRSPKRNRRAGGASNSQHIYCKAADIQLDGVSKWDLAKFLRSINGRGGVGTYCRTKSVHIDIGPKRDWHHPCRRSVLRRKRKA